jgi:hypothetical protein
MKCMYFGNKKGRNSKVVINVRIRGKHIAGRTRPRYQEVHHRVLGRRDVCAGLVAKGPTKHRDAEAHICTKTGTTRCSLHSILP